MASGGTFEVHHPEKIKLLKRSVVVFKADGDIPEIPDECESVSLMLAETVSYLEAPVC